MSDVILAWSGAAGLDGAERARAAGWIHSLDPVFFGLFGLDEARLEAVLGALLDDPGSEFGACRFVRLDGRLAGLLACFPAAQAFPRRIQVVKALLAAAPDAALARQRLKGHAGAARQVPAATHYLARLFVAPDCRRRGVAGALLGRFLAEARAAGSAACLHVEAANAAALALYRAHGFAPAGAPDAGGYLLMTHPSEDPTCTSTTTAATT